MSNDYKSDYYGPECYVMKAESMKNVSMQLPKPNYNLVFLDAEGNEVGVLNFEGPGLSFEGVADLSAITFMDHVSRQFQLRLKQERNKVRTELEADLLALKKGVAANSEYIQGRWDLIGEFQDIIRKGIEK